MTREKNDLVEGILVLVSFAAAILATFFYIIPEIGLDVPLFGTILFGLEVSFLLGFSVALSLMVIFEAIKSVFERPYHG